MQTFSDIVDAADGLSADEQQALLELLQRRITERNRARLVEEVAEARQEYANGMAKPSSVKEIMDEVRGES